MNEATTPRTLEETTTSALVPGAHIEVAFSKLGMDARKYLKGDDPDNGYYTIEQPLILPNTLPYVLEALYQIQAEGTPQGREIAAALVENITTKNDLTDEELSVLHSIAKTGGRALLRKVQEATPGMSQALGKIRYKGCCSACDFKVPIYPGRYPKYCPDCGSELSLKEMPELGEGTSFNEVKDALKILRQRVRMVKGAGLNESVAAKTFPLPEKATSIQKTLLGEGGDATPIQIFEALSLYLMESKDPGCDKLVGVLFGKFPLEEGLTDRLRQEVKKRPALTQSIKALQEAPKASAPDANYFTLNKALSSCFTRVMIEGETLGGSNYKFLGKCIFEMMQRALDGDLQGPSRFLNVFFLEG